ncbi:MAG: excinuclease ABC subunit UvrA, partial [Candidatus Eisenbacteria bacterium]
MGKAGKGETGKPLKIDEAPGPERDFISVKGAREHNLKNIDVRVPRNSLVVVTGVSGSGKSSLAFDTICAEGQRRYVESLSAYARQFLGQMEKPDVDSIEGLSPAISIEQRTAGANPRSTVATVTELYDYLRLLFSRLGTQYCHKCDLPVGAQTPSEIVDSLLEAAAGKTVEIMAPLVRGRKGEYKKELAEAHKRGFLRARIDGELVELEGIRPLKKTKKHSIDILVDRLTVSDKNKGRLADSVETALKAGSDTVSVLVGPGREMLFSARRACVKCGTGFDELSPRDFSFNSPYGACPVCEGLGSRLEIDPTLVVPDPRLSIWDGAIAPWGKCDTRWFGTHMKALAKHYGFDLKAPFERLLQQVRDIVLFGTGEDEVEFTYASSKFTVKHRGRYRGIIPDLQRRYKSTSSDLVRQWVESFMAPGVCPACRGKRLKPESLAVRLAGRGIDEYASLSVGQALSAFEKLVFKESETVVAGPILKEITQRLGFLCDVGLDYLTLERNAATLAGGEAQRLRLATQIGSKLSGVLYVLDE